MSANLIEGNTGIADSSSPFDAVSIPDSGSLATVDEQQAITDAGIQQSPPPADSNWWDEVRFTDDEQVAESAQAAEETPTPSELAPSPTDAPLDPKAKDFQELRGHRDRLETELKAIAPVVEKVQQVGGAQVIDMLAPIFTRFNEQDSQQAGQAVMGATDAIKNLQSYNPRAASLIKEGAFENYKDTYLSWILQDKGLNPVESDSIVGEFDRYLEWKANGGILQGDFEPLPFPEPNTEGYVRLLDGTELDVNDPAHKVAYENAKRLHQFEQQDKLRQHQEQQKGLQTAAERQRQQQEQIQQQRQQLATVWVQERDTAAEEMFKKLNFNAGNEADTKLASQLGTALYREMVLGDSQFRELMQDGQGLAAERAGAAADRAMELDRLVQKHLVAAHKAVMTLFAERARYKDMAAKGQPRIPVVPNGNGNQASVPSPPAGSVDDIWSQVR